MAFIPIPNAARVALEFVIGGVPVVLTIGIARADAPSVANMGAVASNINFWWENTLRLLQASEAVLEGTRVTDQSTQFGPEVFVPKVSPNTGAVGGQAVSNNVSCYVNFLTALRGKAHRGGNFVPGLPEVIPEGPTTWSAATIAALLAAYGTLESNIAVSGWNQAVLSRTLNGAPRAVGVATDVNGYSADNTIDDIGRRLR